MKKFILLLAISTYLLSCLPILIPVPRDNHKTCYSIWSVRNCTDADLTLTVYKQNLYLSKGEEREIHHDFQEVHSIEKNDPDLFRTILSAGKVSVYSENTLLKTWESDKSDNRNFFNQSAWLYEFEKPYTHRWTFEINPEDIGL